MTSLTLQIPEPLADFVTRQAAEAGLASPEAYVLALIQAARKNAKRARVGALLLEGLDSGPAAPMTERDWDEMRREYDERTANARST